LALNRPPRLDDRDLPLLWDAWPGLLALRNVRQRFVWVDARVKERIAVEVVARRWPVARRLAEAGDNEASSEGSLEGGSASKRGEFRGDTGSTYAGDGGDDHSLVAARSGHAPMVQPGSAVSRPGLGPGLTAAARGVTIAARGGEGGSTPPARAGRRESLVGIVGRVRGPQLFGRSRQLGEERRRAAAQSAAAG